jgi:hypothetical protein
MARKTDELTFHAADCIWGSPTHPERSFPNSKPGTKVADITNEFILGLDTLRAYDASVDIGHQTLRLADEEVSLWSPGAGPRSSSLTVEEDQVIPAQCEGTVMDRLETPLGVENGLVE